MCVEKLTAFSLQCYPCPITLRSKRILSSALIPLSLPTLLNTGCYLSSKATKEHYVNVLASPGLEQSESI